MEHMTTSILHIPWTPPAKVHSGGSSSLWTSHHGIAPMSNPAMERVLLASEARPINPSERRDGFSAETMKIMKRFGDRNLIHGGNYKELQLSELSYEHKKALKVSKCVFCISKWILSTKICCEWMKESCHKTPQYSAYQKISHLCEALWCKWLC